MSSKKSFRNLLSVSLSKGAPGAGSGASKMGSWLPSTESIRAGVRPGKRHMTYTGGASYIRRAFGRDRNRAATNPSCWEAAARRAWMRLERMVEMVRPRRARDGLRKAAVRIGAAALSGPQL